MTVSAPEPIHIVIAGGGVAAVELVLALRDLAGTRVRMTIVAPEPELELRALRTAELFSADHRRHHSLADIADRVGAELVADRVLAVNAGRHEVRLGKSGILGYGALVLAAGARTRTAYARALTFTGDADSPEYHGLLADLDGHWTRSVAFVVPPGTSWPLPLYELALMTARETQAMGIDDARLQIVTPEPTPMAIFGPAASQAVAGLLARAGVRFVGETHARPDTDGRLVLLPGDEPLEAERVVALPTIEGLEIGGVPGDERGFIPVDEHGRGLACQQADAVAELLAAAAGADVQPQPFRPILRGRLLIGHGVQVLERALTADAAPRPRSEVRLWAGHRKVDGRYLSPWLAEVDGVPAAIDRPDEPGEEHIDVEVPLTGVYSFGHDALGLDPYSPLTRR